MKRSMKRIIDIKGTAQGAIIKIDEGASIEDIVEKLGEQLSSSSFYSSSQFIGTMGRFLSYRDKAIIDDLIYEKTGKRSASLEEYDEKRTPNALEKRVREEVLAEYQKILDEEIAPKLERLEKELDAEKHAHEIERAKNELTSGNLSIHSGTLRSGSLVRYDGHVVVLGDINAGAEVVAGGNIICLGKALGMVHAGAHGDERAFVFALHLAPTQIRIGRFVSGASKAANNRKKIVPEIARLNNERIVLEEV